MAGWRKPTLLAFPAFLSPSAKCSPTRLPSAQSQGASSGQVSRMGATPSLTADFLPPLPAGQRQLTASGNWEGSKMGANPPLRTQKLNSGIRALPRPHARQGKHVYQGVGAAPPVLTLTAEGDKLNAWKCPRLHLSHTQSSDLHFTRKKGGGGNGRNGVHAFGRGTQTKPRLASPNPDLVQWRKGPENHHVN